MNVYEPAINDFFPLLRICIDKTSDWKVKRSATCWNYTKISCIIIEEKLRGSKVIGIIPSIKIQP